VHRRLAGALLAVVLPAVAAADGGLLRGSVTLAETPAFPPAATLRLELIAGADGAPARRVTLLEQAVAERPSPWRFVLPYEVAASDTGTAVALRAVVYAAGEVLFASEGAQPVQLGADAPAVDLVLQPRRPAPTVAAPAPAVAASAPVAALPAPTAALPTAADAAPVADAAADLTDTYWKLAEVAGAPARTLPGEREAYLLLMDGLATGSSGCNKLMGPYTPGGAGVLRFGALASTRMACPPELAAQEAALNDAFARTSAYRIEGETLSLLDGGQLLARFIARRRD
jgi:heat shock protein HslJ/uncharacterized lipoprotein YbaY